MFIYEKPTVWLFFKRNGPLLGLWLFAAAWSVGFGLALAHAVRTAAVCP